jgi:quinol monooxygenase YgiN
MSYVVEATWIAEVGHAETVLEALRQLAPLSRAEPGCRFYQVYGDPAEPRVFRIFEIYDDEAAFAEHGASEHFQRYGFGLAIPLLENRERAFFETLDF